jgi:hypothetical protein
MKLYTTLTELRGAYPELFEEVKRDAEAATYEPITEEHMDMPLVDVLGGNIIVAYCVDEVLRSHQEIPDFTDLTKDRKWIIVGYMTSNHGGDVYYVPTRPI